jgi:hypothetical protein
MVLLRTDQTDLATHHHVVQLRPFIRALATEHCTHLHHSRTATKLHVSLILHEEIWIICSVLVRIQVHRVKFIRMYTAPAAPDRLASVDN